MNNIIPNTEEGIPNVKKSDTSSLELQDNIGGKIAAITSLPVAKQMCNSPSFSVTIEVGLNDQKNHVVVLDEGISYTFREIFENTPQNAKFIEHNELMSILGSGFLQSISAILRDREAAGNDPWTDWTSTCINIKYSDGTLSQRILFAHDEMSDAGFGATQDIQYGLQK